MANEHHDERGRFCSAKQERVAQARVQGEIDDLTMTGKIHEAMALSDRYNELWPGAAHLTPAEIETAGFDSINVGGLLDKARGLFSGRRDKIGHTAQALTPVEPTLPPLPPGRFALEGENGQQNEFQDYSTEFKNIQGFYRVTGDEAQDSAIRDRSDRLDTVWGNQQAMQDAEAEVIFDGTTGFVTAQEQGYFYNPELKASIPNLKGWVPENETQAFVVKKMVDAALDQKHAAFLNADIVQDPAADILNEGLEGEEPGGAMKFAVGQDSNEDSGPISNYDEGWLTGYYTAVTAATREHFDAGDSSNQKAQLGTFLAAQREHWQQRVDLVDNDFNAGALDGFAEDNWASEL